MAQSFVPTFFFCTFEAVNLKYRILTLLLYMMTFMPSFCYTPDTDSTQILNRIWDYQRNYSQPVSGLEQNVYLRYGFGTVRRNVLLFLVPTMYVIAKGDRNYIGESYSKIKFQEIGKYDRWRQVKCSTIPRNRTAMPAMLQSITPNFYDVTIYPDFLLSPFHRSNQRFYRYTIHIAEGRLAIIHFKPKTVNTQLINGQAVVDKMTGRLQSVQFEGEFDMIAFKVSALMNIKDVHTPLPERCSTEATFRFLGNCVKAHCTAVYNCPTTLPDSIHEVVDRKWMERLRPVPLSAEDQRIYDEQDEEDRLAEAKAAQDTTTTEKKSFKWIKEVFWDIIGDNLINGNNTSTGPVSMRFSPLLNPLYFGYSPSRGLSYRLRLGIAYNWNEHRYLTLDPQLGYNFKLKQFFYTIPLRMNYNPKRNGYAEILFANGNRTSNAALEDDFYKVMGHDQDMPEYKDQYLQVINNVVAYDWLEIKTGLVYHRRRSLDPILMEKAGMDTKYNSFAPLLSVRLTPWYKGPTLTANYERGINNILQSNLRYERWEFDAVYMRAMKSLSNLSLRGGIGFYSHRNTDYFVDFSNFRDNNLPSGWEDDWSGQFQLLNAKWYNASNYYVRGHITYESPLLALSHLPWIGRYFERERLYFSALSIEHTRPYFELGYGFTNRFFSAGLFTNFLGGKMHKVEAKITVELFRRW